MQEIIIKFLIFWPGFFCGVLLMGFIQIAKYYYKKPISKKSKHEPVYDSKVAQRLRSKNEYNTYGQRIHPEDK